MAFCERCGNSINSGVQFCRSCGAAVGGLVPQIEQPAPPNTPQSIQSAQPVYIPATPRPLSPIPIGLVAFAVAALIGIGLGLGWTNRQQVASPVAAQPLVGLVAVPDLLGIKETQARDAAKSKSLKLEITTGASNDVPAGQVASQYPPAGQAVAPGSTMRVRISTGAPGSASRVAASKSNAPTVIVVPAQSVAPIVRREEPVLPYRVSASAPSYNYPLSYSDLAGKSAWDLDVMRNTIYAKYGRRFARSDLQSYFNRQPWYRPYSGFHDGMLTSIERRNAALILQHQNGR